jgi:translation elongation factor EF-G
MEAIATGETLNLDGQIALPIAQSIPPVYALAIAAANRKDEHQTEGHGQFGDVFLDIQPLDRGAGFQFNEKIGGGIVPKQYIPGVETGVREYLDHGPLGLPVVDVAVTLTNGYHNIDSSEQAATMPNWTGRAGMKGWCYCPRRRCPI